MSSMMEERAALMQNIDTKARAIEMLQQANTNLSTRVAELEKLNTAREEKIILLEKMHRNRLSDINTIREQADALAAENARLKAEVVSWKKHGKKCVKGVDDGDD